MLNIVGNYSRTSPRSESRAGEERGETCANTPIPGGETGAGQEKSGRSAGYRPESVQWEHNGGYEAASASEHKTRTGQICGFSLPPGTGVPARGQGRSAVPVRHSGRAAGGGGGTDTVGAP